MLPSQRDARSASEYPKSLAAWLELVTWWRWAFTVCVDRSGPRTAHLCLKLVTEPVRIWLWLAHGERVGRRVSAAMSDGQEDVGDAQAAGQLAGGAAQ